jgi:hypothetical protein
MDITDPIFWYSIERLIVVLSAALFGFLGYRIYISSFTKAKKNLNLQSLFLNFAISGAGPGLLFMVLGALILVLSVSNGGISETTKIKKLEEQTAELLEAIRKVELQSELNPHEELKELRSAINELYLQNTKLNETPFLSEPYIRTQCKLIDSPRKKGLLFCPKGYVLVGAEKQANPNDGLEKLICCPAES